ncbi:hypothetical protein NTHI1209_01258 [Haemophilus influenzae]|uniref:Uncharacterized protein n=1 Tax=Haemophilus influenzae TaxID=727 RepID=A0A158SXQ7_HAEIF|nr:hypothetical protein NTHI1209_01258 [Haemophilus influenzae]
MITRIMTLIILIILFKRGEKAPHSLSTLTILRCSC